MVEGWAVWTVPVVPWLSRRARLRWARLERFLGGEWPPARPDGEPQRESAGSRWGRERRSHGDRRLWGRPGTARGFRKSQRRTDLPDRHTNRGTRSTGRSRGRSTECSTDSRGRDGDDVRREGPGVVAAGGESLPGLAVPRRSRSAELR